MQSSPYQARCLGKEGNVRQSSYKQVLLTALVGIVKKGTRAEKEYHRDLNMALEGVVELAGL